MFWLMFVGKLNRRKSNTCELMKTSMSVVNYRKNKDGTVNDAFQIKSLNWFARGKLPPFNHPSPVNSMISGQYAFFLKKCQLP